MPASWIAASPAREYFSISVLGTKSDGIAPGWALNACTIDLNPVPVAPRAPHRRPIRARETQPGAGPPQPARLGKTKSELITEPYT